MDAAHTRHKSKKAARELQEETTLHMKSSRLQFTDEERAAPELAKYIRKSDKAADRLDAVSYTHLDVYKRQMWDFSVIKDILMNPVYTGAIASQKKDYRFKIGTIGEKKPQDWIVVEERHEPLIDSKSFAIVQDLSLIHIYRIDTETQQSDRA